MYLQGQIIGFDEYMNITLDDAVEYDTKTNKNSDIGRILLKGDAITVLQAANPPPPKPSSWLIDRIMMMMGWNV